MDTLSEPLPIPVSTTFTIDGRAIDRHIGPVFGLIARSTGFARGVKGSFKAFRRGEVSEFTQTLEDARRSAIERLVVNAQDLGADAVVGLRFDSTDMGQQQGMAEIVAYGTAVRLRR